MTTCRSILILICALGAAAPALARPHLAGAAAPRGETRLASLAQGPGHGRDRPAPGTGLHVARGGHKADCPPGLAKKGTGCRPPGLAKAAPRPGAEGPRIGGRVPPGFRLIDDPYRYGLIEDGMYYHKSGTVIRVDDRTDRIVAIIGRIEGLR